MCPLVNESAGTISFHDDPDGTAQDLLVQSTSGGAGVSFDGRGTAFMAVPAGSPLHGRRPRRRLPVTGRVGLRLGLGRYRRRRNSRAHPHRRQRVRRRPTRPHPRRALSDVATTLSQGDARISFGKRAASQAASRHSPRATDVAPMSMRSGCRACCSRSWCRRVRCSAGALMGVGAVRRAGAA